MDFDPRNRAARTKRAGYPATNSFTIHELRGLPPLFDWVDCASGHSNFKMLLGGDDDISCCARVGINTTDYA